MDKHFFQNFGSLFREDLVRASFGGFSQERSGMSLFYRLYQRKIWYGNFFGGFTRKRSRMDTLSRCYQEKSGINILWKFTRERSGISVFIFKFCFYRRDLHFSIFDKLPKVDLFLFSVHTINLKLSPYIFNYLSFLVSKQFVLLSHKLQLASLKLAAKMN